MSNEWSNRSDRSDDSDKHTAATLAAALIARGFSLPAATNASMAADQAVELYRAVLRKLSSPEMDVVNAPALKPEQASSSEQQEMDTLGVSRVDCAKYYYGDYRYDNLGDALRYARAHYSTA